MLCYLNREKVFCLQSSDIAVSNSASGAAISGGPPTIARFHNYNNCATSSIDFEGDDTEEVAQRSSKFAAIGYYTFTLFAYYICICAGIIQNNYLASIYTETHTYTIKYAHYINKHIGLQTAE